jgi:hypothetical protein
MYVNNEVDPEHRDAKCLIDVVDEIKSKRKARKREETRRRIHRIGRFFYIFSPAIILIFILARLLSKQGRLPKRVITDKLRSYGAAKAAVMPKVEHRQHKGLNNRAENSHVPIRRRERMMQGFRSWSGLQRFVSIFSAIRNHFVPPRSQRSTSSNYVHRLKAIAEWKSVTAAQA